MTILAIVAVVAVTIYATGYYFVRAVRVRKTRACGCGYQRVGIPSEAPCPECGREYSSRRGLALIFRSKGPAVALLLSMTMLAGSLLWSGDWVRIAPTSIQARYWSIDAPPDSRAWREIQRRHFRVPEQAIIFGKVRLPLAKCEGLNAAHDLRHAAERIVREWQRTQVWSLECALAVLCQASPESPLLLLSLEELCVQPHSYPLHVRTQAALALAAVGRAHESCRPMARAALMRVAVHDGHSRGLHRIFVAPAAVLGLRSMDDALTQAEYFSTLDILMRVDVGLSAHSEVSLQAACLLLDHGPAEFATHFTTSVSRMERHGFILPSEHTLYSTFGRALELPRDERASWLRTVDTSGDEPLQAVLPELLSRMTQK